MLLEDPMGEIIATREYFPSEFGRSVRQKTRWTTGIALQTMMRWGNYASPLKYPSWKNLMARYGVWRDRKALWANPLVFLAWSALAFLLVLSWNNPDWMSDFKSKNLLATLMSANLVLFGIRLLQRTRFTTKVYGMKHGLLVSVRLILGSVINALAAIKAVKQFSVAKAGKKENRIEWDKTEHFFPTDAELGEHYEQVVQ
jgi:adsorption protein B